MGTDLDFPRLCNWGGGYLNKTYVTLGSSRKAAAMSKLNSYDIKTCQGAR